MGSATRHDLGHNLRRLLGPFRLTVCKTRDLLERMAVTSEDAQNTRPQTRWTHGDIRRELLFTTSLLEGQARTAPTSSRIAYVVAATLCAYAAAECVLNEWLRLRDADTYVRITRERWPLLRVLEELLPKVAGSLPPHVMVMINVKSFLCDPEPERARTKQVDNWLAGDGAQRALAVALTLESLFFPGDAAAAVVDTQN